MNSKPRLWMGVLVALVALAVMTTGVALARADDALPARPGPRTGGDPFMGIADPAAPYDRRFLDEMIMHHQGAIMSARMMIADSARPELRDLARRIIAGQQRQVDQLRAWRQAWYPDADPLAMDMEALMDGGLMGGHAGGLMGGGMMGGMMGGDRADRMFLRMMIPHHQLAIDMAEDALANAGHDDLKGLARAIVADQSAEIAEMEGYLQAWYGEGSTRGQAGAMRDRMRGMRGGAGCH